MDDDEKKMFLEDLGLTESGLEKLVKASYHLLGLMSFLTSGEDETEPGQLKSEQKLLRQQVRSIQILKEDLLKLRL